jgi:hypothetical protein
MRCDDLDVLDLPLAVGPLVLDADVREVDLVVDDGQIMLTRPFGDFAVERIGITLAAPTLSVQFSEEPLVIPLQFVIEHNSPHRAATSLQAVSGIEVRTVQLSVMREFPALDDPCIKLLLWFPSLPTAVRFQEFSATIGQRDEHGLLASHYVRHRVHQFGFAKAAEVACSHVCGLLAVINEILRGHDAERSRCGQDPDFGSP